MTRTLRLQNIGPITDATLTFSDLTVLVGPQASGKSITLQWVKLLQDTGSIHKQLVDYGLDWSGDLCKFLDIYFGEGMNPLWKEEKSTVHWNGKTVDPKQLAKRKGGSRKESVFFIPAQRVLALRDGWPRPFGDYAPGDPYTVRSYSEKLRMLMEKELSSPAAIFPRPKRLKQDYRSLLARNIFSHFHLSVDTHRSQRRLVLGQNDASNPLPYMVWSAGQREFVPLLLGLYWLMPPTKTPRRESIEWVVIEELEMGLHPRAISTVLLLVLELIVRGYRVCLSSHSPQVLETVWAMQNLRSAEAQPSDLLKIFGAPTSQPLRAMAEKALKKRMKVFYFEGPSKDDFKGAGGTVHDITDLDPNSEKPDEASWGGLLEFSSRASDAVARAMANR
jgi:hypothetical protein